MCAAACAMFGLTHVMLFLHQRRAAVYVLSSLMAFSACSGALIELALMRADSIAAYAQLLVWENFAVYVLLMSMVWYVQVHFGSARRWLAVAITALWSLAILVNFLSPYSLVFERIDAIRQLPTFWGETFGQAVGRDNPWKWLADSASILITLYVIDASVRAWRAGYRRRAMVVGGSMAVFIVSAGIHAPLVDTGVVATPYMVSFAFLAIVLAMTYELVAEAVSAGRLQREVATTRGRWDSLMQNVKMAVVGIDSRGTIDYANPFFERLSGYPKAALLGQHVSRMVPAADAMGVKRRLDHAAREGPRSRVRATLVTASGERREMDWTTLQRFGPDGTHAGLLTIGVDLTDQLRAQADLRRTEREMERLARASILGELATALAHELNQPLTAILSNAQAARRFMDAGSVDPVELREILEDVIRDDKRAGDIIHRLRAMLRKGEIAQEWLSIGQVVAEAVALVRSELEGQGVDLQTELAPNLPPVEAGRVELQQVMVNLLLNAARAMRDTAPPRRRIAIRAGLQDGRIEVAVEDRGHGIAPENLSRVFDPFFTTASEGIGMGLAICRRIVEAHGGRIRAQNNDAGGATILFSLPLSKSEPADG